MAQCLPNFGLRIFLESPSPKVKAASTKWHYMANIKLCFCLSTSFSPVGWIEVSLKVMQENDLYTLYASCKPEMIYNKGFNKNMENWMMGRLLGIVTRLWTGQLRNGGSTLGRVKRFFSSLQHPDWLWGPSNLLPNVYWLWQWWWYSWGAKHETEPSLPPITEVKNVWM